MNSQTHAEPDLLRRLLGCLIPPSERYDLPGADDPAIAAEIAATLATRMVDMATLLAALSGEALQDRSTAAAQAVADRLKSVDAGAFEALTVALAQCYYRDDRVLERLGMEARPPFPKGFEVEQGDWSLLEPVRARGKIWREA